MTFTAAEKLAEIERNIKLMRGIDGADWLLKPHIDILVAIAEDYRKEAAR